MISRASQTARRRLRGPAVALLLAIASLLGTAAPAAAAGPPRLAVTGASLTVAADGERLFGVNADRHLLIASTTKLMTALVVFQHVKNMSEQFTDPNWRPAAVDSQIGLNPGERMSVHDLMVALMLPSADDAAYDLAYNIGHGSVARFVAEMNADAVALGLRNTHYANPIGLDASDNYSSAYDLTRLAAYMLAHYPFFARIVRLQHATLRTGNYVRHITNTDTLLGVVPWITGVKTGHTNAAGYILVSSGTRHGLTLIAAVLGTTSEAARNANALALLDYGFSSFRAVTALSRGQVIRRLPVTGESRRAVVIAASAWHNVLPKADRVGYAVSLPRAVTGPRRAHSRIGTATILVNGHDAGTVALVLGRPVPAEPMLTKVAHFFGRPTTLGLLALVLGVTLTAFELRRRRPRAVSRRRAELEAR